MTGERPPSWAVPRMRYLRRGPRIAIIVVAGVALVASVVVALAEAPLASPPVLAHDPVPRGHVRWAIPAGCGITPATLGAINPGAIVDDDGVDGHCLWRSSANRPGTAPDLEAEITPYHAGTAVPGADNTGDASVAAAMAEFARLPAPSDKYTVRPVTGLGDEALLGYQNTEDAQLELAEFRTDNIVVTVQYGTRQIGEAKNAVPAAALQAGALRAAADIARTLGAPAAPKPAPPPRPASVHLPRSLCDLLPSGLRDRLVPKDTYGDRDIGAGPAQFAVDEGYAPTSAADDNACDVTAGGRRLTVAIGVRAEPDAVRGYLLDHLDARADRALSVHDPHYFHALSGLGDQAFGQYGAHGPAVEPDQDAPAVHDGQAGRALVVARTSGVLVSVGYGSEADPHAKPLTRDEAVNGAYAMAAEVVDTVAP